MGKILVKQQSTAGAIDPAFLTSGPGGGTQVFTGAGGLQSFIDPSRRDLSAIQPTTLGTHPTHFIHPDSGQVLEHPLAGQPIVNPNAGQSQYTTGDKALMYGTRGLGGLLGAYSALMSFANDDDQDALTSALNALGQGYTSYAATAPAEQMFGRRADRRLAGSTAAQSAAEGADAMPVHGPEPSPVPLPPPRRGEVAVTEVPSSRDRGRTFYGTGDGLAELPSVDFIPKDEPKMLDDAKKDIDDTWAGHIPDVSPPPPEELTDDEKKDIQRILTEYGFDFTEGGQFD